MQNCPNCSVWNPDHETRCRHCGGDLPIVRRMKGRSHRPAIIAVAAIIAAALILGVVMWLWVTDDGDEPDEEEVDNDLCEDGKRLTVDFSYSDTIVENSTEVIAYNADWHCIMGMSITLTWVDESTAFIGGTNEPDEMGLEVETPAGDVIISLNLSTTGSHSAEYEYPEEIPQRKDALSGDWTIRILCGECGDDHDQFNFRTEPDTSCTYTLTIEFEYIAAENEV